MTVVSPENTGTAPTAEHGTLTAYTQHACRCDDCRAVASRYATRKYRLIAYGRWRPYVDAEPVRRHVNMLRACGIGWTRIAELAGVPRGNVSKLLYGDPWHKRPPLRRLRPATAAALLALKPDTDLLGGHALVDATGTQRRVQALVFMGWSQSKIAERAGIDRSAFGKAMQAKRVYASTARIIRRVYDELWRQAPPEDTPGDRISCAQARAHAHRNGWVSPLAWDEEDLDDPRARPRGVCRDDAATVAQVTLGEVA